MATLEEQMQQEFLELQKSDEQDDVTKKPVPTQNVTETKTAPNDTSLQDQMEQEFKQQDVATTATETYVEKQNNIVVSEDQLREQAAARASPGTAPRSGTGSPSCRNSVGFSPFSFAGRDGKGQPVFRRRQRAVQPAQQGRQGGQQGQQGQEQEFSSAKV